MKKFLLFALLAFALAAPCHVYAQGGNTPNFSFTTPLYTGTTAPGLQAPMFENSLVTSHTLTWTVSGTVSSCTVAIQTSATAGGSFVTIGAAQTCTASGTYTFEGTGATAAYVAINISALSATGTVTFTYNGYYQTQGAGLTDGIWNVPLGACGFALTTGTFAANPANSGGLSAPAMVRTQTSEQVLQITTTAATNTETLDCDITPPSRTTTGKGITITGYTLYYAVQTTALTSITTPTVSSIAFLAFGGTAAGTVTAGLAGTLTLNPVTLQLATTTAGSCYSANVTFSTPIAVNPTNTRYETTWAFNQSAAAATVLQVCGLQVYYNTNAN